MTNFTLTPEWIEVVPGDSEYLLQSLDGAGITIVNSAGQPTTSAGFYIDRDATVSSVVYPAVDGIWARSNDARALVAVDTWV